MITEINKYKDILNYSNEIQYHILNGINICENIMRPGSSSFENIITESRKLYESGFTNFTKHDTTLFSTTDIGKKGIYEGKEVMLDLPYEILENINEAEYKGREVELNKPERNKSKSGKKYYVFVNDGDKVKKISFGDVKGGLKAKVSDPDARKAFSQRHNCPLKVKKKDAKLTAGYWACVLPRYGYLWGNKTYNGYW